MEEKEIYITAQGLEKLKNELFEVENIKLKEIAAKIAEAKDLGDLAENSEYHEAKQEQAFYFGKAVELRYKIKRAKIIKNHQGSKIAVGSAVKVKLGGESMNFTLVGSEESDPANGKISSDSPIGRALIGHQAGDKVLVLTPVGKNEYEIIQVN